MLQRARMRRALETSFCQTLLRGEFGSRRLAAQEVAGNELKVDGFKEKLRARGDAGEPCLRQLPLGGEDVDKILDAVLVGFERGVVGLVGGFKKRNGGLLFSKCGAEGDVR